MNTPHNPSGRVYALDTLRVVGETLSTASRRLGHTIHLVSDEPYNRIIFDGRTFHSPAEVYPGTITTYLYGKTLLAPGMRIGYIAVPPAAPDREALRDAIFTSQIASGYAFPNALLQHAIEDLDQLSVDVGTLQRRRNRVVGALREMGYETTLPEGTFLRHGPGPDPRRRGVRGHAHGARRPRPPRVGRGGAGLVPDLAHGERRDG